MDALKEIERKFYNIVLLDNKLPDIDGINLIKPIKEKNFDIEILMMTGFASIESSIHALNEGASGYITKPLNMEEIFSVVGKLLEKQQLLFEKRAVERKLKESEKKYRLIIENAQEGILTIDDNGYTTFTNERMAEILGYKVEEMIGKHLFTFINQEREILTNNHLNQWKRGLTKTLDLKFLRRDGKQIYIMLEPSTIIDEDGNYNGTLIFAADITERKKAEKNLKKSEFKYRSLFDNMLEGFALCKIIVDENNKPVDFVYLEVNDAFERLTGLEKNRTIGKRVSELIPNIKDSEPNLFEIYGKVALTGETTKFEIFFEPLKIWLLLSVYSIKKGYFVVVFDNITERKKAEHVIKKERERAEQYLDLAGVIIIALNQKGIITLLNKKGHKILGYEEGELIGKNWFEECLPARTKHEILEIFTNLINGDTESVEYFEIIVKTKKGKEKLIAWYNTLLYDDKGKIVGTLSSGEDITKRKETDNLIKEEIRKLKELDQIKNDLTRRVSHELNTPLISIYSAASLLLDVYRDDLTSRTLKIIEMIKDGGERLKGLASSLVDIYDLESNKINLDLKMFNITEILEFCIKELQPLIIRRKHELEFDISQEVYLKVDYIRIKKAILNLLENAIKYTPPKGKIYIKLHEFDKHVEIIIKDIGVGFTEQEKGKIFKKFGKIERHGKGMFVDTEGPGLGLYISRKIVRLHDGDIFLKSEGRNKGSIFVMQIPKKNQH